MSPGCPWPQVQKGKLQDRSYFNLSQSTKLCTLKHTIQMPQLQKYRVQNLTY